MLALEGKRDQVVKWFLPIGGFFAVSLYASNQAYFYSHVTFLQFMKQGNVILGFLLSCAIGLEVVTRARVAVILWILTGSLICVTQDLHFVLLGFGFQLLSQFAEVTRIVMGEIVLSGNNMKLDPLTYTLIVAPICFMFVCVGTFASWSPEILEDFAVVWPYLIPNACMAFLLNLLVATIIKETSAVGMILLGLTKDVFLVSVSAVAFGDVVTPLQGVSFTMIILGIICWSLMKTSPDHPLVRAIERFVGQPHSGERTPLISKASVVESGSEDESLSTTASERSSTV